MMDKVALQLYSLKDAMASDLIKTIKKVAQIGYTAVQFAGFNDIAAKEVKDTLRSLGLKPAGAHVSIDYLRDQLDDVLIYHDMIENDYIIVPWIPETMRSTVDDYLRTAELLDKIGHHLHLRGFKLGYHNHDFEFTTFGDKTGLEIILDHTDPTHLHLELDCYWGAYKKMDPLAFIDRYADRCLSLHIKDLKEGDGSLAISTELGRGILPLKDYVEKGKEVNVRWLVVEQEHFEQDPFTSAEDNLQVMKKLMS